MSLAIEPSGAVAPPPAGAMLQMISSFWVSRAIYVAARLGIADQLHEKAKTPAELALATKTHAPSLYRVLRALASVGVFAEEREGRFALTPLGATLRSGVPGSLRAFAIAELGEDHYAAWQQLMYSVKTGEVAFDRVFGAPIWQYYAEHPEDGKVYDEAMAGLTTATNAAIASAYDFSSIATLVDVGGGDGTLLASILKAYPTMRGVLFDLPSVVERARARLGDEGVAERCQLVAGDFFGSVPSGGDTYLLKWIIHDWDDERAVTILANCRRAMRGGGTLLVVEGVIPPGNEPFFGKLTDLDMLVMTGGRERTETEYAALLEAAGFRLRELVATPSSMHVIDGVAV